MYPYLFSHFLYWHSEGVELPGNRVDPPVGRKHACHRRLLTRNFKCFVVFCQIMNRLQDGMQYQLLHEYNRTT